MINKEASKSVEVENDNNDDNIEEKKDDDDADEGDVNMMKNALCSCPLMIPFWPKILQCDRILIAGCGGGYDCYQGLLFIWIVCF